MLSLSIFWGKLLDFKTNSSLSAPINSLCSWLTPDTTIQHQSLFLASICHVFKGKRFRSNFTNAQKICAENLYCCTKVACMDVWKIAWSLFSILTKWLKNKLKSKCFSDKWLWTVHVHFVRVPVLVATYLTAQQHEHIAKRSRHFLQPLHLWRCKCKSC